MNVYQSNMLFCFLYNGAFKIAHSLKKVDIKKYADEKRLPVSTKTFDRYLKYLINEKYIAEGIKDFGNIKKYYITEAGLEFLKKNFNVSDELIEKLIENPKALKEQKKEKTGQ